MLSEGWDARNVTQILGLRAFQSQLLCEQVIGRGLRRSDHTDLTQPEYVDEGLFGQVTYVGGALVSSVRAERDWPEAARIETLGEYDDLLRTDD